MRTFFKFILGTLLILVLLVLGLSFFVDGIARKQVEESASSAFGVRTTVQDLDLGVLQGRCSLTGVEVANAPGFQAPTFMALASGSMKLNLSSLLSDQVRVPRLALSGVDLILEQKGARSNVSVILENARRRSGEAPPAERPGDEKAKKYLIDLVEIRDVTMRVETAALGREAAHDIQVPLIRLENVGADSGGVVLTQLCALLLREIIEEVLEKGRGRLSADILGDLSRGLEGPRDLKVSPGDLPSPGGILDGAKGILGPREKRE